MGSHQLTVQIKQAALDIGFSSVGVSCISPIVRDRVQEWLDRGYHGEMGYMAANIERRLDPSKIMPEIQSIVSLTLDYFRSDWQPPYQRSDYGVVSRYALGKDYHRVMGVRLKQFLREICRLEPSAAGRYYVDTGPVMDKFWAARAGLGWIGKHTNLIAQQRGSWFFLGEVLLNLELESDRPATDHCGSCTRCIEACPTDAIVEPYVLDSRRCISYLTIELREEIPAPLRSSMANLIFGCDICQDVCPWNRFTRETEVAEFTERDRDYSLKQLARLTPETFGRVFSGSAIKRAKWRGFMRNIAVAMGNSRSEKFVPALERLLRCGDSMVVEHAVWALRRIGTEKAGQVLSESGYETGRQAEAQQDG